MQNIQNMYALKYAKYTNYVKKIALCRIFTPHFADGQWRIVDIDVLYYFDIEAPNIEAKYLQYLGFFFHIWPLWYRRFFWYLHSKHVYLYWNLCVNIKGASILILACPACAGQWAAIAGCRSLLWYWVLIAVRMFTPRGGLPAMVQAGGGGGSGEPPPHLLACCGCGSLDSQLKRDHCLIAHRTVCLHSPAE